MPVFMVNVFWINISGLSYLLGGCWLVLCYIDGAASSPINFPKGGLPMMPVFMVNGVWINISRLSCLLRGSWLVLCYIGGAASSPILLTKKVGWQWCLCLRWVFLSKHQQTALFTQRGLTSFVQYRWRCSLAHFTFQKGGLPVMPVFTVNGFWINISGLSCLLGGSWLVLCYIDGTASSPILLS